MQGVGFRPSVYRFAKEAGLTGSVKNTRIGVFIEIEGVSEILKPGMSLTGKVQNGSIREL